MAPSNNKNKKTLTASNSSPIAISPPNWTTMCHGEIFFNDQSAEQSIILFNEDQSPSDLLSDATIKIYENAGLSSKISAAALPAYVEETGIKIKETYVPPSTGESTKVLCTISSEKYEKVKNSLEKLPDLPIVDLAIPPNTVDTGVFLELSKNDYESYFSNISNIMTKVGKDYEFAYRSGEYNVPNLRFSNEIKKIKEFKKSLNDLMEENGVPISSPSFEKIGLVMDSEPNGAPKGVGSVWSKKVTQPWEKLEKGFSDFKRQDSVIDKNVLSIIMSLPSINRKSSFGYIDFIESYFYPSRSPKEPSSPKLGETNLGAFGNTIPGNEVKGFLTKYSDTFNENIPSEFSTGYNLLQKKELQKIINDPNVLNRRVADSLNRSLPQIDPVVSRISDAISTAGTLDDLYAEILNPLGLGGIIELLSDGVLNKLKNLPLDKSFKEISAAILDTLPEEQIYELFLSLFGSIPADDLFLELRSAFEDFAWPDLHPDLPIPDLSEISLPSFATKGAFNPTNLPRETCIGIPGLQAKDINLGRIKKVLIHIVRNDFVKPERFADFLSRSPGLKENKATKLVFNFGTKSDKSTRSGSRSRSRSDRSSSRSAASDRAKSKNSIFVKKTPDPKGHYRKNKTRTKAKLSSLSLPFIPAIPSLNIGDTAKIAKKVVLGTLEKAASKVIKTLLKKVLNSIFDSAKNTKSPDPKRLRDTLTKNIARPGASNKDVNSKLNRLFNSFSIWDPSKKQPGERDVGSFIDTLSDSLTNQEMIDLFNGKASKEKLCKVRQVMDNMDNPLISDALPSNADIDNMFASLGTLIDRNALQAQEDIDNLLNTPRLTADLCANPATLELADRFAATALANKGLSPDKIDDQLKLAQDLSLSELGDLVKALSSPDDLIANLSDLPIKNTPHGAILSPMSSDPRSPGDGLFPMEDESTKKVIGDTYRNLYSVLNASTISDLTVGNPRNITSRGFLDMVLASENGRPFSTISDSLFSGENGFFNSPSVPHKISDLDTKLVLSNFNIQRFSPYSIVTSYENDPTRINFSYEIGSSMVVSGPDYDDDLMINPGDIVDISSNNEIPSDLFSSWVYDIWSDHLSDSLNDSPQIKSSILAKIREFSEESLYQRIIESQVGILSGQIKNNSRGWYSTSGSSEGSKANFSGSLGTPVMKFLDEDTYGNGTFYIDIEGTSGFTDWAEIYMAAAPPSILGNKAPLFDFLDQSDQTIEYFDNMPDDPRIEALDESFPKEAPFCRINTRLNNAGIAGLIEAVVRMSVYETILKATPAFQVYSPTNLNYDDLFVAYIVQNIISSIEDQSQKTLKFLPGTLGKKGYYFLFLEQVVQSYSNLVSLGFKEIEDATEMSLESIKKKVSNWDPKKLNFNKQFKEVMESALPDIKVILASMVRAELEVVSNKLRNIYKPSVINILEEVIENPTWVYGSLSTGGPLVVPSLPSDPYLNDKQVSFIYETDVGKEEYYVPFVLEKYIKITNKLTGAESISSPDALNPLAKDDNEYHAGVRISMVMPSDFASTFTPEETTSLTDSLQSIYSSANSFIGDIDGTPYYSFPIIKEEIPIQFEESQTETVYLELAKKLPENQEFKLLYERCFPIKNILSYLTIYVAESFIESLTPREALFPVAFNLWNGEMFETSKKYLKSAIQQFYYGKSSDFLDQLDTASDPVSKISNTASGAVMSAATSGLNLTRKQKKKLREKPHDVE
mgnify:CR=1 FL=1